jgi:hypothetical protein
LRDAIGLSVPPVPPIRPIHLCPAWDTPAGRELALRLGELAAAAPPEAVVYKARNTLVRLDLLGTTAVVKCFPARTGWQRRWSRSSKAVKAYANAAELRRRGLGTPEPLAAVEGDDGRSWFACAWIDGCRSVWNLHDGALPDADRHCEELGAFIGRLHQAGCDHRDLTPGNVLLRPQGDGYEHLLVDCNRMRFVPVSARAGLARLVSLECQGRTLAGYCRVRGIPLPWARRFFAAVAGWHRFKWQLKDRTRPWRRRLAGRAHQH